MMREITFESYLKETGGSENKKILDNAREELKDFYKKGEDTSPLVFLNLPKNKEFFEEAKEISKKIKTPSLKYIFLAGVGGSYLGTKAIYDALNGYFSDNNLNEEDYPKIIFLNNTDPSYLKKIKKFISEEVEDIEEFALLFISKSGKTIETVSNSDFLIKEFEEKFEDISRRVVVITEKGSDFEKKADEKGFFKVFIPKKLSGRFSVFSTVSLVPLLLVGFDLEKLREGANDLMKTQILEEGEEVLFSAISIFKNLKEGKNINIDFYFNPELETLGLWLSQLKSESLGKKENKDGKTIHTGVTPVVAIGPRDLHSLFQLVVSGPSNKLSNFVYSFENGEFEQAEKITGALFEGVKKVYKEEKIPYTETNLGKISEYSLGWFMQFKMLEVYYVGKLLNIDVFNQPEVERYKEKAREILKN